MAAPPRQPSVLAAGDQPDDQKRARTVAILPAKAYATVPADVFGPAAMPGADPSAVESAAVTALAATPFVAVQPPADVRRALLASADIAAKLQAAQQLYRLGLELYLGLASGRAAEKLQQATRGYDEVFADLVEPKAFADAWFMLGVALVDANQAAQGHVAIKAGFALQPDRRFRRDLFPPNAAAAIAAAHTDFVSTADAARLYGDNQRLTAMARRLGVDALLLLAVRTGTDGPQVHAAMFSARKRLVDAEADFPYADLAEHIDAFASRWQACADIDMAAAPAPTQPKVWADAALSFAPFLRQPTRRDFQSLGFAGGADIDLRDNLHWFARVGMHTSLPDPYRDLLRSFNSVRLVTGLGAVFRAGPLRLFANLGVDAHLLGSFQTSNDPNCKLFGVDHRLCNKSSVLDLGQQVLFGANAGVGGQLHLGRDFILALRVSLSNYFLPLSGTDRLNRPLGLELGFGYRL